MFAVDYLSADARPLPNRDPCSLLFPRSIRRQTPPKSSSPLLKETSAFSQQPFDSFYSFFTKRTASSSGHRRYISEMKGSIIIKPLLFSLYHKYLDGRRLLRYFAIWGGKTYRNYRNIHNKYIFRIKRYLLCVLEII
jgi:hypothetical protein